MNPNTIAIKRIFKDISSLRQDSLESEGIYMHTDDKDIWTARFLLIGPEDTPYHNGFYFFEFRFPSNYPFEPPAVSFATLDGSLRFNPNLYTNGKVCLSIINTWTGPKWTSCQTVRSVLLSLRALVLGVRYPIQNEPGYEDVVDERAQGYNEILRYENIRVAVLKMAESPPVGFESFQPILRDWIQRNSGWYREQLNAMLPKEGHRVRSPIYGMSVRYGVRALIERLDRIAPATIRTAMRHEETQAVHKQFPANAGNVVQRTGGVQTKQKEKSDQSTSEITEWKRTLKKRAKELVACEDEIQRLQRHADTLKEDIMMITGRLNELNVDYASLSVSQSTVSKKEPDTKHYKSGAKEIKTSQSESKTDKVSTKPILPERVHYVPGSVETSTDLSRYVHEKSVESLFGFQPPRGTAPPSISQSVAQEEKSIHIKQSALTAQAKQAHDTHFGTPATKEIREIDVVSISSKTTNGGKKRVPNENAAAFDFGYKMISQNDGREYMVVEGRRGATRFKRWGLVKRVVFEKEA